METITYDEIYQLMKQLDVVLCQLEKMGEHVPCISTNVKLIKAHANMLAIELGCEEQ